MAGLGFKGGNSTDSKSVSGTDFSF
jgi:hypothetical protein